MRQQSIIGALIAAAATVVLAAAPAVAQDAADWQKVVDAAKKEGTLTFYIANAGNAQIAEMVRQFEAKTGIKVNKLEAPPPALAERVRSEANTGKAIGDVAEFGGTTQALLSKEGVLQGFGYLPNLKKLKIKQGVPEEVPGWVNGYALMINTNLVSSDREPKSWKDLLDPQWKGKILANDFDVSGAGQSWFSVTLAAFGQGYHEQLAKQNLTFFGGSPRAQMTRVAQGEFAMEVPILLPEINGLKGLPVKAIIPEEGLPYTAVSITTLKGAPHPNAARVFLNFVLEEQTQLIFAKAGFIPTTDVPDSEVPQDLRWMVHAKLLGTQDLEGQNERMALAGKIYKNK